MTEIEKLLEDYTHALHKIEYVFNFEHGPSEEFIDRCDELHDAIIDAFRERDERIEELEIVLDGLVEIGEATKDELKDRLNLWCDEEHIEVSRVSEAVLYRRLRDALESAYAALRKE